jgi:predicted site-specific integrase-resolvase
VIRGEFSTQVSTHKDHLARFGFELLTHLCETHDCQIVELNTESLSPEQEMVQDMMTIIDCFSSRLFGLRNYGRAIQKALQDGQSTQNTAQPHA